MNDEQREKFVESAKGKAITNAEWVAEDRYWALTFEDGTELCVRLMIDEYRVEQAALADAREEGRDQGREEGRQRGEREAADGWRGNWDAARREAFEKAARVCAATHRWGCDCRAKVSALVDQPPPDTTIDALAYDALAKEFIASMEWRPETPAETRELVENNIRGFAIMVSTRRRRQ